MTHFKRLNSGWDAEPNSPRPQIHVDSCQLALTFYLNWMIHPDAKECDRGRLTFFGCWRYRLGSPNDEGWWRKQDRFGLLAPQWGLFYEITGDLLIEAAGSWIGLAECHKEALTHHYLFYFRDNTFECDADGWSFEKIPFLDNDPDC